jgi:hypothetical protein
MWCRYIQNYFTCILFSSLEHHICEITVCTPIPKKKRLSWTLVVFIDIVKEYYSVAGYEPFLTHFRISLISKKSFRMMFLIFINIVYAEMILHILIVDGIFRKYNTFFFIINKVSCNRYNITINIFITCKICLMNFKFHFKNNNFTSTTRMQL